MANPELERLLGATVPFAKDMVEKYGEFYPYGAALQTDEQVGLLQGGPEGENPPVQAVLDAVIEGLRQAAGEGRIRASAVCIDMRVTRPGETEKTNAICVQLEHAEGEAIDVYVPYSKQSEGEVAFGEMFAGPGEARIFGGA